MAVEVCFNGEGVMIPPLFIFPRVRMNMELQNGAPTDSIFEYNKSGWMMKEIFSVWMRHFINYSKPGPTNWVLLHLVGHSTHIKNIDVINMARKNYIDILCFPPHTTHKLQPLDVGYMGPLKTYTNKILEYHMRTKGNIQLHDLVGIYNLATIEINSITVAINAFKRTGKIPINENIFTESEYLPSQSFIQPSMPPSDEHLSREIGLYIYNINIYLHNMSIIIIYRFRPRYCPTFRYTGCK